jgi:hypothetical protein
MQKKNPFRFTIQFDKTDPAQYLAAQVITVLPARKKTRFLAMLIQSYVNEHGLDHVALPELDSKASGLSAWIDEKK